MSQDTSRTGDKLVDVEDLSVAFTQDGSQTLAVDRVSFHISEGETLALVGESGSGKSVSALSLMQLLPYPAASHPSGTIRYRGKNVVGADERTLMGIRGNEISMIFQEPMTSLNPLHTIERQVGEVLAVHQLNIAFQEERQFIPAVQNLSFTLRRGETLAIVGESGSGKSVTALALMRLLEQTGGQISSEKMLLRRRNRQVIDLNELSGAQMQGVRY